MVLCKYGCRRGEVWEGAVKDKEVMLLSAKAKSEHGDHYSPNFCRIYQTWMWNATQLSQMHARKICYIKGACGDSQ